MIQLIKTPEIKQPIPPIKEGDIFSATYKGEFHLIYVHRVYDDTALNLVSLNHLTSYWNGVTWWNNEHDNNFTDIKILTTGTLFSII